MALERFDDPDGADEAKPERQPHHGGTGRDAHAAQARPVEHRSRAEYYEALRVADGKSDHADDNKPETTDADTGNPGWDAVDPEKRPPLDSLRVSSDRRTHILDGDSHGGGHRHGTGRPGKTEFPASWSDEKIINALLDVASRPDQQPKHQEWKDRWVTRGTRDDVEVVAVIGRDGRIWTGWPQSGPGVVKNPQER
jgi:hypothetical protein